jgi:hypothetical protein
MLKALLCKIVIMLVQEVSVSKLGLQLGGSEEKTQLVSYNLPRTEILDVALKSRLQICPSHVSEPRPKC